MRTKYKLGQMINSPEGSGVIDELRVKRVREEGKPDSTETTYIVESGKEVGEDTVTAVFRPVAPRKTQTKRTVTSKKSAAAKAA